MHDEIRKFSLAGELRDTEIVKTKQRLVDFVESQMRDYDYVPALDIEPQFTLEYLPETESYEFTLSVYGVQIERENVWQSSGVSRGKILHKSTMKNK